MGPVSPWSPFGPLFPCFPGGPKSRNAKRESCLRGFYRTKNFLALLNLAPGRTNCNHILTCKSYVECFATILAVVFWSACRRRLILTNVITEHQGTVFSEWDFDRQEDCRNPLLSGSQGGSGTATRRNRQRRLCMVHYRQALHDMTNKLSFGTWSCGDHQDAKQWLRNLTESHVRD